MHHSNGVIHKCESELWHDKNDQGFSDRHRHQHHQQKSHRAVFPDNTKNRTGLRKIEASAVFSASMPKYLSKNNVSSSPGGGAIGESSSIEPLIQIGEKQVKSFKYINEILKRNLKLINKIIQVVDDKRTSQSSDEWKEVATRVDLIFLIFSTLTVILVPLLLFGRFYFRTDESLLHNKNCACIF